jgi:hypothetical protein
MIRNFVLSHLLLHYILSLLFAQRINACCYLMIDERYKQQGLTYNYNCVQLLLVCRRRRLYSGSEETEPAITTTTNSSSMLLCSADYHHYHFVDLRIDRIENSRCHDRSRSLGRQSERRWLADNARHQSAQRLDRQEQCAFRYILYLDRSSTAQHVSCTIGSCWRFVGR